MAGWGQRMETLECQDYIDTLFLGQMYDVYYGVSGHFTKGSGDHHSAFHSYRFFHAFTQYLLSTYYVCCRQL